MYELITNRGDIRNELLETVRCFSDKLGTTVINFTYVKSAQISLFITIDDKYYTFNFACKETKNATEYKRYDIYVNKFALYKALSTHFKTELPWGSLTGIRPTRLAARLLQKGYTVEHIAQTLQSDYAVSPAKAHLTAQIINIQRERMPALQAHKDWVNLYVHIPFCPTRCAYCSFITEGIEHKRSLLAPYVQALVKEILLTKQIVEKQNKRIFSVYIGGGTPTILPEDMLEQVLRAAFAENVEFTCEAGRPDTIDETKLQIMHRCGVNRISINPQTLHDKTLQAIGRAHTTKQFLDAYYTAMQYPFVKNVDLIAGLEGETENDFSYSLNRILDLAPENITVHTLCIKRGSRNALDEQARNRHTEAMIDYSIKALQKTYLPYYLYRQKQMTSNLENIGWCKPNHLCVNNVTVMEETLSVYACGAGAISKLIVPGRIQRLANPKEVTLYLAQFDERMRKKAAFLYGTEN